MIETTEIQDWSPTALLFAFQKVGSSLSLDSPEEPALSPVFAVKRVHLWGEHAVVRVVPEEVPEIGLQMRLPYELDHIAIVDDI